MPKIIQNILKISEYLVYLEDADLYRKKSRVKSFEGLKSIFDEGSVVTPTEVQRTLTVFMNCLKEDIQCIPHAISTISSLLTKAQITPSLPVQDWLPSALDLLNILKTVCVGKTTKKFREMSFALFLLYPVDVLGTLVTCNCSEILEIFKVYKLKHNLEDEITNEICMFLQKLLTLLPPEQKRQFVKEGVSIWFSELVPAVMTILHLNYFETKLPLIECLETLTDVLLDVDYFQCPEWQDVILECICNTTKYPQMIKEQLQKGSNMWHRIWIVLVKILKNQITRNFGTYGTPINSMLPAVEFAFKMDVPNRCRAFMCWDNLIDNFSKETNENCLPKRIKLLLIPLKLNNAKTAETAVAKCQTWWNFIRKFQFKLEKFTNEIIIGFIHFAFGKEATDKKPAAPGMGLVYTGVRNTCLQAFVQIVGHANCDCCPDIPKLNGKLMTNKLLASHWDDWMHTLKIAVQMTDMILKECGKSNPNIGPMPVLCIWKAFVTAVSELPPNGVRRDMFNGLIQVLIDLTENCNNKENLSDILFSLTRFLFTNDENIKNVLLTSKGEELPLQKVLSVLIKPELCEVYKRYDTEIAVAILRPMTDLAVESIYADWLLDNLLPSDGSLKLWTALVHKLKDSDKDICTPKLLHKVLMWPLKAMHQLSDDKYAAMAWYTIYNLNVTSLSNTDLDKYILECISKQDENNNKHLKLYITIGLLKKMLVEENEGGVLPKILQNLISQMSDYKEFEEAFPIIVDTIVMILNTMTGVENTKLGTIALNCVINVLKMFISGRKFLDNETSDRNNTNIYKILHNMFNALELVFKVPYYCTINCIFIDKLIELALSLRKDTNFFMFIISEMKLISLNCSIKEVQSKINNLIEMEGTNKIEVTKEFIPPVVKKPVKRTKKKETSIVNTVVENGEEYVVVKSNWMFNPRKLTENQKEKFQKKREDIPALYQDLSQSQDEFKMSSWKTDSQDTTSSTSKSEKSMTNDDTTNILKNTENCDVVPKIMENILSEKNYISEPKPPNIEDTVCDLQHDKPNKVERLSLSTPKINKSPRMALKDRVFRNVRNLIEKSTPNKNDNTDIIIGEYKIGDVPETHFVNKNNDTNNTNTVSAERPSRVKRTPKKFEDVKLFPLKKRRTPHSNSQLDTNIDVLDENMHNKQVSNETDEYIDVNNTIINQEISNESTEVTICEDMTRTVEVEHSVQGTPAQEVATVSEPAKDSSDEPIILNEYCNRQSDIAQDDQTSNVIKDKARNENKEPGFNNNVTTDLNSKPINDNISVTLKTPAKRTKEATQKSSTKKSRIEKELAIDMVESHPFLKIQSEKRITRTNKRQSLTIKSHKTKKELDISPKVGKKLKKGKSTPSSSGSFVTVEETQERRSSSPESASTTNDAPCSEDVIESSQDSTFTTISVKSTKKTPVRLPNVPVVCEKIDSISSNLKNTGTQDLLHNTDSEVLTMTNLSENQETKDDIELPQNKTADVDKNQSELTENMDTELLADKNMFAVDDDAIVINDNSPTIIVNSEKSVGPETQKIAEADTQPNNDPVDFLVFDNIDATTNPEITHIPADATEYVTANKNASFRGFKTQVDDIDMSLEPNNLSAPCCNQDTDMCSPFKDDVQRKQDFLNNTSEISPIKGQSPDKEKTPSPQRKGETSNDFMVVKLSSPVQINGEPFDKCASPEFFTDDKVSPDKREQSPPRAEVSANSGSPSSSLSLKKNRPQAMRPGGRAAHMLGLCVPDSLNTMKNSEKVESEEPKKGNISTPARRNLRVLYNAVSENSDNLGESEEHDTFLKFKKVLPPTHCSPSVPILKRKLIDIVDDTTASPANKRKRVSFHDPPVSTTVSVQKYIEPGCVKSPSSAQKRLERQMTRSYMKSPKRLDNAFVKLDTVLFKAVESFTEDTVGSLTNDTNASLDVTPAVTVVNTSDLNDTDPICPDLVECTDAIENIATELSSPAMKMLLIQELEGKVVTVGDLAKMTELEVNRLCIKAPKVQIAKKVLADYVSKRAVNAEDVNVPEKMSLVNDTALATEMNEEMTESEPMSVQTQTDNLVNNTPVAINMNEVVTKPEPMTISAEAQTDKVSVYDAEIQTRNEIVKLAVTQTDVVCTAHSSMQTEESGFKTTSDVISSCLSEREDFVDKLGTHLTETSIRNISEKLSIDTIIDILAMRSDNATVKLTLNKILQRQSQNVPNEEKNSKELTVLMDYLWDRFDGRDLILLCSKLLQKVYDKPA